MTTFDKLALFAALKPKTKVIDLEGFGKITLMQLTVTQSDDLRAKLNKDDKSSEFGLRLLAASVIDENGDYVMTEEDCKELKKVAGAKIEVLVNEVLILNNYKKAEAGKNLETAPSDSSASG